MSPEECFRKNGRAPGMADAVGPGRTSRFVDESDEEFRKIYEAGDGQEQEL